MSENLLDNIKDNVTNTNVDNRAFAEESSYEYKSDQRKLTEIDILKAQVDKLELKNKRYKDNTEIRRTLVIAFTMIIAFWLLAVLLVLAGNNCNHYNLSENTLITLMVTSTANVIGMMLVILKNLFPEKTIKIKQTEK